MCCKPILAVVCGILACVTWSSVALGQPGVGRPLVVPLDQAVRDRWVEAEVASLGSAAGDVLLVTVRRTRPMPLRLGLSPGTVFMNYARDTQNMVGMVIKGEQTGPTTYINTGGVIYLDDDERHTYVIEGYCLDFHKNQPRTTDRFVINPPSEREARIAQIAAKKSASTQAIQAAIWIARDHHLSASALKQRFQLSDDEISLARGIVAEADRPPTEPSVAVGDYVYPNWDRVPLMVGHRVVALLSSGTPLRVTEAKGSWLGVSVTLDGQEQLGWVKKAHVHTHTLAR